MAAPSCIVSLAIAERDLNGDVMVTWSYPATSKPLDDEIQQRPGLQVEGAEEEDETWSFHNTWMYTHTVTNRVKSEILPQTVALSISIQAKDYDPDKYACLCKILANVYISSGNPLRLLEGFLSVFTLGKFGSFDTAHFDSKRCPPSLHHVGESQS